MNWPRKPLVLFLAILGMEDLRTDFRRGRHLPV
jgi:hypothetical protein